MVTPDLCEIPSVLLLRIKYQSVGRRVTWETGTIVEKRLEISEIIEATTSITTRRENQARKRDEVDVHLYIYVY